MWDSLFDKENRWLFDGEKRLDASFYAKDVIASRVLMGELEEKGVQVNRIENLSDKIFWPGRFKRRYVSKREGDPFIMPSEVIMFLPKPKRFIIDYPGGVSIKENWLLITRSGSIGRCLIVTKPLERYVLSDDLIRIIPKNENNVGYLYAYFNTWIGQAFLTKDQYGSTVKHIEPHHVANIPIPRVLELEERTNQKILEAHRLREEAQEHLLKAEEILYSELELPEIDDGGVEYFGGGSGRIVKSFEIKASELNLRLDASYHAPILRLIKKALKDSEKESRYTLKKLKDVAKAFDLPTYKRIYVEPNEGIPILSGTHLRQIKLLDLEYISGLSFYKSGKNFLDKYRVKKGWVLTTERGTIGISSLVTNAWDNWLASHNILRIVPKNINPGYLLAFLNTEHAQYQLKSKGLGAVVEVLDPRDMEDIFIPVPNEDIQRKIGSIVIDAYNKKDRANQIEDEAIKLLERRLKEIAEGKND